MISNGSCGSQPLTITGRIASHEHSQLAVARCPRLGPVELDQTSARVTTGSSICRVGMLARLDMVTWKWHESLDLYIWFCEHLLTWFLIFTNHLIMNWMPMSKIWVPNRRWIMTLGVNLGVSSAHLYLELWKPRKKPSGPAVSQAFWRRTNSTSTSNH